MLDFGPNQVALVNPLSFTLCPLNEAVCLSLLNPLPVLQSVPEQQDSRQCWKVPDEGGPGLLGENMLGRTLKSFWAAPSIWL